MRYQAYELRREVLMFKADDYTKSLLVLFEHIDWSTGKKEATSWDHMKNWLNQLCTKYNIDWEVMTNAIQPAIDKGWLTLSADGRVLSLGDKPERSLMDEVGPVETVEKPYTSPYPIPLTRENIRKTTGCPKCGAEKGLMCKGEKKGLNNREANHKERSQAAARILKGSNTPV